MFGGGRPGIADAAPLAGYSPLVIVDAILLVSSFGMSYFFLFFWQIEPLGFFFFFFKIMLGIDEWTRDEIVEYNLQDLTVIVAMDDMRKRVLPRIMKLEEKSPAEWRALGIQIFRQATVVARPRVTVV